MRFAARTIVLLAILSIVIVAGSALLVLRSTSQPAFKRQASVSSGFKDIAPEAGIAFHMAFLPEEQGEKFKINLYDHGCGVAVADIDGDGFEDIYFANQLGPNALYKNKGDGTFVDVTAQARVGLGDRICVGATFADFNNDGLPDLYVTSTRGGNVLFQNLGGCKFKDVTKQAGLTWVGHSQTAAFFDYDKDGFLDLFVTNSGKWTADTLDGTGRYFPGTVDFLTLLKSPKEYNVLYHNNGDGTFTDVTARAGLKGRGWGGDVAVFDYNEDGHLDLLVSSMFGVSQLYRNNGDGTFTDVTVETLGRTSWGAIGCKAFDYDNDGKLDLLIVDMHSDMWVPAPKPGAKSSPAFPEELLAFVKAKENVRFPYITGPRSPTDAARWEFEDTLQIKVEQVIFGNTLFKNLGNGKFQEVAEAAGVESFWPWGIVSGDFDNDGHEDLFLPSGMGYPFFYWPNRLLMNTGNGTFSERSHLEGIEPPRKGAYLEQQLGGNPAPRSSRCAAVADFRNAGRLDIVTNNFNDHPYYFQNQFPRKNYIAFRLQGTKSNRDAIGALVRLSLGEEVMVRQVQAAGGYLSHSSRILHFGLGNRTKVDKATITWPSGTRQVIDDCRVNMLHSVIEPSGNNRSD